MNRTPSWRSAVGNSHTPPVVDQLRRLQVHPISRAFRPTRLATDPRSYRPGTQSVLSDDQSTAWKCTIIHLEQDISPASRYGIRARWIRHGKAKGESPDCMKRGLGVTGGNAVRFGPLKMRIYNTNHGDMSRGAFQSLCATRWLIRCNSSTPKKSSKTRQVPRLERMSRIRGFL